MNARTISLLIAEPLSIVRAGLRALLQGEEGMVVVGEAADGAKLAGMVARLRPDILLLEPALPGPPVGGLLIEVAAIHPPLKVVILADPRDSAMAIALLEAGAGGCILKSDRPEELARGVRGVAAGELPISSSIARKLLEKGRQGLSPGDVLTEREREILDLLTAGLPNKEIAQRLYLSVRTVEVHLRNVYSKLGVRSRLEAVTYSLGHGPPASGGWPG
jgi:DNA-binding NarL/FixJ family response regulator